MKKVKPSTQETGYKSPDRIMPNGHLRKLACIDCVAGPGEGCVSGTGKELSQVHISRRRVAIRNYRAEQEANGDE